MFGGRVLISLALFLVSNSERDYFFYQLSLGVFIENKCGENSGVHVTEAADTQPDGIIVLAF